MRLAWIFFIVCLLWVFTIVVNCQSQDYDSDDIKEKVEKFRERFIEEMDTVDDRQRIYTPRELRDAIWKMEQFNKRYGNDYDPDLDDPDDDNDNDE